MSRLRWGILGVAKINRRLLPGFRAAGNAEVVAIASRSVDKARRAAFDAGIATAHGSYEALLDDPHVDAVYIPLPNHLHAEWAKKAADRGKHILCEKPLCPAAAEAAEVVDYCRAKGVKLLDGFMWPHHPRTARIRKLIDDGGIGRVLHASGTFTFKLDLDPANIRLHSESGGGSLLDVGCYPVYGIRWAFGEEPVRVVAAARLLSGVDLSLSGVLQFADGRTATFDTGFHAPMRQWFEVVGETGTIFVPEMWAPGETATYEIRRDGREPEQVTLPPADQIAAMIEEFGHAVAEGRDPRPGGGEAVKTLKVMDALAASARGLRAVEV